MSDILYVQTCANTEVTTPHVYLQDIVQLSCSNSQTLNRLRVLPVIDFSQMQQQQCVLSVSALTKQILQKEPSLQIEYLGSDNFIVTYHPQNLSMLFQWGKIFLICIGAFFGSAFSIMTFNRDADVTGLFQQIYTQITGTASNGFTILEISYSIGIGLGVLFFFNHFGKRKLSGDPTPLQIQMCLYEDDVNQTVIQNAARADSKY